MFQYALDGMHDRGVRWSQPPSLPEPDVSTLHRDALVTYLIAFGVLACTFAAGYVSTPV